MIKFQAKAKGLFFELKRGKNQREDFKSMRFNSDPNRLKQVILNLLGNALKFTEKGGITISVETYSYNPEAILISVEDTGLGIKQEDIPRLFKLFGKLDDKSRKKMNESGVGLGLALSQSLVKLLNMGRKDALIKVESELGKGSRFFFPLFPMNEQPDSPKFKKSPKKIESRSQSSESIPLNKQEFIESSHHSVQPRTINIKMDQSQKESGKIKRNTIIIVIMRYYKKFTNRTLF